MKIIREIAIYQKHRDKLIANFPITASVEELVEILNVNVDDDANVYKVHGVDKIQFNKLCLLVPELLRYNFDEVAVSYECYQI